MKNTQQVITLLEDILSDTTNRYQKVSNFVTTVMKVDEAKNGQYEYSNYINDLAYDLEFYDPSPEMQKKYGFYGDEKLEILLKKAIKELKNA